MLNKNTIKSIFIFSITAAIIFTGCSKDSPLPGYEEITATETTSETVSETVSESPVTKAQTTESETVTDPKSYEPYQIKLYDSLGTGMPRPDNYGEDRTRYSVSLFDDPEIFFSLMKDRSVAEKIKDEISKWTDSIEEKYNADGEKLYKNYCNAYNGILFYRKLFNYTFEEYVIIFDMRTGERLELSDMFFEGEEFISRLNKKIGQEMQKLTYMEAEDYEPIDYLPMKREFSGLTENGFYFNANEFCFPPDNPYFQDCRQVRVSLFDFDTVLNVPYDMTGLFEDGADKQLRFNTRNYDFSTSYFSQTGNVDIFLLDESPKLTKEQREFLNNKALSLASSEYIQKMREKSWSIYSGNEDPVYNIHKGADGTEYEYKDIFTIDISILNNDLALIYCRQSNLWDSPVPSYSLYFDLKTLEPLDTEQLFERIFGEEEYVWDYVYIYSPESSYTTMDGFIRNETPDISKIQTEDIITFDGSALDYYGKVDDSSIWGSIYKKTSSEN
ncbi:MAG: hypothetical protein J1F11_00120 [Oscillospiraceae bacterium]|nr:hypothetical protein [Oscillospiraceae bacterium]